MLDGYEFSRCLTASGGARIDDEVRMRLSVLFHLQGEGR